MRSSGVASYVVRYRTAAGESRRLTIGRVGVLSPEDARRMAQRQLAAVADGADPVRERRSKRQAPKLENVAVQHGIDALRQFKIFEALEDEDFLDIARIARVRECEVAEKLTTEGAPADQLYLFVKGKAAVKVRGADGRQVLIDEIGPGEVLGWSAITEPYFYTASAWTTRRSYVIAIDGKRLRDLCETNKRIGYQVAKGIGEVISKRFGRVVAGQGAHPIVGREIDELRQFKIFSELEVGDLDAVARIAYVRDFVSGERLTEEGEDAEQLYLLLRGRVAVRVRDADGAEMPLAELGPGELIGWGAVMEPHIYTASACTLEPSELIVINGKDLRELCDTNKRIGYQVAKGVGEVISRRFGLAVGGPGSSGADGAGGRWASPVQHLRGARHRRSVRDRTHRLRALGGGGGRTDRRRGRGRAALLLLEWRGGRQGPRPQGSPGAHR